MFCSVISLPLNTVFANQFSHLVLVAKIPVAKMLNSWLKVAMVIGNLKPQLLPLNAHFSHMAKYLGGK
jgi:hypothetical protein